MHMVGAGKAFSKANSEEEYCVCIESESDEVYRRFGGSALVDMFNMCFMAMKSEKPSNCKEKVSQELHVLKWIRIINMLTLPTSLVYRAQD